MVTLQGPHCAALEKLKAAKNSPQQGMRRAHPGGLPGPNTWYTIADSFAARRYSFSRLHNAKIINGLNSIDRYDRTLQSDGLFRAGHYYREPLAALVLDNSKSRAAVSFIRWRCPERINFAHT